MNSSPIVVVPDVVPRKKRGRPPKNANAANPAVAENGASVNGNAAVIPANQSNGNNIPPVTNTVSKKSSAKENGNSAVPVVPTKKRGRPQNKAIVKSPVISAEADNGSNEDAPAFISTAQFYRDDESVVTSTVGQSELSSSTKSEGEAKSPPKKRGRPMSKEAKATPKEPPKKRGRPKKADSSPKEAVNAKAIAKPVTPASGDAVAPVKRGRGRPKKIQA